MPKQSPDSTIPKPKRDKRHLPSGVAINLWQANTYQQDDWAHWWRFAGLAALGVFLIMQVAGGVLRWVLDMIHLAPLTYVPNLMMLAVIFSLLINDIVDPKKQTAG